MSGSDRAPPGPRDVSAETEDRGHRHRPGRVARAIGAVGRVLIAVGVLLFLFVVYQLWGTGIHEARAQRDLKDDFRTSLEATPDTTTPTRPRVTTTTTPPQPVPGEAVAIIEIPKLGLDKAVVEGVGVSDLKDGPGHYPDTPLPGQPGNAAIAGHRTTYGAPFDHLDELEPGDQIVVTTRQGEFRYEVTESLIVPPSRGDVLDPTDDDRLTLTTCNPRFSAAERLVVISRLLEEPAAAPPTTVPAPGDDEPAPTLDEAGLSGDPAARGPVVAWGLVAAGVWLLTWLVGRRWKRWPAYLVGTPVFLVVLFMLFENVARLVPANI